MYQSTLRKPASDVLNQLSVHILCRRNFRATSKDDRLGFTRIESGQYKGCIESAAWVVCKADRTYARLKALVGGRIYFHDTKATPSVFGGIVRGVEEHPSECDQWGRPRINFIFEPSNKSEGIDWRGEFDQRRAVGRLVPANLPHERSSS